MATKLYVANLPLDYSEQDLHDLFSACGQVTELDIIKNYAFVHMATHEAAQNAMAKYNNSSLHGKILQVQLSRSQNINRANKFTVKYDRPDRMGRGIQGNQFQRGDSRGRGVSSPEIFGGGGINSERYGPDFRGRGGFRGGRGGPDTFHRGKPYDRNPNAGYNQPQTLNSNLKPIQPIGSSLNTTQQSNNSNLKIIQQHQQNIVVPQSNQTARLQVPVQLRSTTGALQAIPTHATNSMMQPQMHHQSNQVMHGQQQILQQNFAYQSVTPYRELQPQGQAVTVTPQQIAGSGIIHQQAIQVAQPGTAMSNVASLVQPAGMASGVNHQQSGNPLQGYTVYERYVDYRNPQTGDIQQLAVQSQVPAAGNGMQTALGPVYQSESAMGSKDPYAGTQLLYER